MKLLEEYEVAPDGSYVRPLLSVGRGSLAHCTLPEAAVSEAVKHRSIDEIWYFIEGEGQVWRRFSEREETVDVGPGVCITIPVGTEFQFRNKGEGPLRFLCFTMPPWPGDEEAVKVRGRWEPQTRNEVDDH
jgi:mannose-6-phosphate isomerase-like protein (cupin superfamily)